MMAGDHLDVQLYEKLCIFLITMKIAKSLCKRTSRLHWLILLSSADHRFAVGKFAPHRSVAGEPRRLGALHLASGTEWITEG